ncbi:YggT family protein [Enterobacteriaceae bacterium ET-AT1-13]|nr:YggT family protein [Enterobacteriaceae bacterium ET-AT1-13]WGS66368.1 YggT family protein [Enterobacteriaceae bacterium Cmel17]WMC17393.1 MAG: YggT family protein [Enterobacteriaceae bacterium Cmel21]WMC17599.1 MAG: YggT family protein [Enterobacteriaceae bacterium PSmelAO3-2]WMC17804.1 MAG: YggT family protein [Enterobacteriaceae bacterium PSmelAO3-1]WMC18007.1 MAG: YggT family protein [Enterobacteriaceae bacterium PSmelAO1]
MLTLNFLVKNIIDFCAISFLLRIWIEWTFLNFEHPFVRFIKKVTQVPINLFKKIIPPINSIYSISLLILFLLMFIKFLLISYIQNTSPIINFYITILLSLISLIKISNYLIFWVISMFVLMNCFQQRSSLFKKFITQLSYKIIEKINFILPNIKNVNYSSLFLILILYLINYIGIDFFGNIWFML